MNNCWVCKTGLTGPYHMCNMCRQNCKHNVTWDNFKAYASQDLFTLMMSVLNHLIFLSENQQEDV